MNTSNVVLNSFILLTYQVIGKAMSLENKHFLFFFLKLLVSVVVPTFYVMENNGYTHHTYN